MATKSRMLRQVRSWQWREVRESLEQNPALRALRDPKGRSWLHLCAAVDPKVRGLRPVDSVRTADVLLDAGLGLDEAAFRVADWKATPLWHAVAWGRNRPLVRHLLARGADPEHGLWAAAYNDDTVTIALLVRSGADLDPVTEDETPLLHAVKTGRYRAAAALLRLGARVDFQDSRGRPAT